MIQGGPEPGNNGNIFANGCKPVGNRFRRCVDQYAGTCLGHVGAGGQCAPGDTSGKVCAGTDITYGAGCQCGPAPGSPLTAMTV